MTTTTTPSVADVLREARRLYAANPSHAPAGQGVPAGQHCVISAIHVATKGLGYYQAARRFFDEAAGTMDAARFNASHSTETVLEVFDRAIRLAESEGA